MEKITLTIGEYRDLISIKKKDIKGKIERESKALHEKGFTDVLYSLSKLNEWKWEYEAICEELDRTAPKFCAEDVPF